MANSALVREDLDTLIAENWDNTVIDLNYDMMPFMGLMFGKFGTKSDFRGIGIPNSGMLLSGVASAQMRKKQILSSLIYQPLIKTGTAPRDGKAMGMTDNMPSRTAWEQNSPTKRFTRPAAKWVEIADAAEVPNEHIRHTQRAAAGERNGWEALGDLLRVERNDTAAEHLKRWNELFWGVYDGTDGNDQGISTSGSPSDESDEKWDAPHSIKNALSASNTYCGVDRSLAANAYFRGNTISAATSPVFRDMIRYANYTLGLSKKGQGLDVILVGGDLFPIALSEADAKGGGQVVTAGTPIKEFGQFGFKRDTVRIDNTWIVYDPTCPAGDAVGLNLKTWTLAIHPDANFKQSTPYDNSQQKGGDDSTSWTLRTKLLCVCEAPSLNVYWDNVA